MTDRPMIFSGPMVRALLGARKSMTRRILSPATSLFNGGPWSRTAKAQTWNWAGAWVDPGPSPAGNDGPYLKLPWLSGDNDGFEGTVHRVYPAWQTGDRLWCREAWRTESRAYDDLAPSDMDADYPVIYDADADWGVNKTVGRRRPSIFMPRWASRLTLTVTEVRVERVQDISEADARAEGVGLYVPGHGFITDSELRADPGYSNFLSPRAGFEALWTEIHGPGAWQRNDWVAALTFTVHRANIADVPEAA